MGLVRLPSQMLLNLNHDTPLRHRLRNRYHVRSPAPFREPFKKSISCDWNPNRTHENVQSNYIRQKIMASCPGDWSYRTVTDVYGPDFYLIDEYPMLEAAKKKGYSKVSN